LIKKVDRQPRTRVESVLLSEGSAYAQLYLGLLKKVIRSDTQQCLLVWIADALTGEDGYTTRGALVWCLMDFIEHEERIPLFTRMDQVDSDLPYLPLLKYATTSSELSVAAETLLDALMHKTSSFN
jgi:V-type H+-transporting ATPase subunit H